VSEPCCSAAELLKELWAKHSRAYCTDEPGFGLIAQNWWCETCRTRYPCEIARTIGRWGQVWPASEAEYRPMRAPVVGEVMSENGRTIRIEDEGRSYSGVIA
jgi:hypothetical protein